MYSSLSGAVLYFEEIIYYRGRAAKQKALLVCEFCLIYIHKMSRQDSLFAT